MTKIVGVRFRNTGKIYYFDPARYKIETGDHVIVETARGVEMGTVVLGPRSVEDEEVVKPLKAVIRVATENDERIAEKNRQKEQEAFALDSLDAEAHIAGEPVLAAAVQTGALYF